VPYVVGAPPGPNTLVTLELLRQDGQQPPQTVQALALSAADAQLPANRYDDHGPLDDEIIKYVRVVIP
jgi:hypothetical protein